MKKILYTMGLLLAFGSMAQAAPGDTTWVQANQVNLNYFNNFDTTVLFPDGNTTYRKIIMYFTMGQYNCDPSEQYCHQWDYDIENYVMTADGDTLELSRLISPYANSGWSRFGSSWQQPYIFDVTDFANYLKDSATIRLHYAGYSGGFTADVKFAFIEGTPDRDVVGIDKLYDFSHNFGDANDSYNNYLPTKSFTAPAGTETAALRYLVTGHGNDDNGCCEFMENAYTVQLNNQIILNQNVWRDDCPINQLYPQGGTWIFERANWCPGASVRPLVHDLPNITTGTPFDLALQYNAYSSPGGDLGSYKSNAIVVYYGDFNKTLDASIDDIMAPTNDPNYYRENPTGSNPQIILHNGGSTAITSIDFSYGVVDSAVHTYNWTGNLAPLAVDTIQLPAVEELINLSVNEVSGTHQFKVVIDGVNGTQDDDATNNEMTSEFDAAPLWPSDLILDLKTSNIVENNGQYFLGNPQQKWEITDMAGNLVASRSNTSANTQYHDTIAMPAAGLYKLKISTNNDMGLHWWVFDGQGVAAGAFKLRNYNTGALIPMKNYVYSGTAHDDFGREYVTYFSVAGPGSFVTGIDDILPGNSVKIYPNPANDFINVVFTKPLNKVINLRLVNALGQTVYRQTTRDQKIIINTKELASGNYTLLIDGDQTRGYQQKVTILK